MILTPAAQPVMDERQKLQRLFQFDLWCTRKLIKALQEELGCNQKPACLAYLSHIVNVQQNWYNRVTDSEEEPVDVWTEYSPAELRKKARRVHVKWLDLIGDHEVDLNSLIYYRNSQGAEFAGFLRNICQHVIIHGEHHRAQVSLFFRKCGLEPLALDYADYLCTVPDALGQ